MNDYIDKLKYLDTVVLLDLEEAFKRGDKKYKGKKHSHAEHVLKREIDEDIRHVRELHVDVRLREAEECASNDDFSGALNKIISAIGYLIILHMRITEKLYDK
jgi:hypothetical protein